MTQLQEAMRTIRSKIKENREQAASIRAVYKFIFEGPEGGIWMFHLKGEPDLSESDSPADCTLKVSLADGLGLLEGRVNGQELFFSGRLRIEGDVTLALRLQSLLDILK